MIDLTPKLTPKMRRAESVDGKPVILKHTDEHEVEVLRRLQYNASTKPTRIIPLLDVIDGRLMVLPSRTPLPHFLDFDASVSDVEELALQFLEGVAYLQHCSVAHLDLKPDNIVVQRDPKSKKVDLAIIDFNIAVFADAEPTISTSNGTSGWRAPEVSAGKPYDPLLADRWSCGQVLTDFTKRMKPSQLRERMQVLSQQLMDPNPCQRPPIPDRPSLCPQRMGGTLNASIRSRRDGAPRPSGQPRRSSRVKGLGPQDHASSLVVKTRMDRTLGLREEVC
jgi:serine/threonine protein kinase